MNDDDFENVIQALREEGDRPAPSARMMRQRILTDLRRSSRKRPSIWWIPVAAVLLGSTVLAAKGGLPEVVHVAARALGIEAPREDAARTEVPRSGSGSRGASPSPPAAEPAQKAPPERARPAVESDSLEPKTPAVATGRKAKWDGGAPRSAAPSVTGSSSNSTSDLVGPTPTAPEDDGTLALYRKARQLHFVDQNPAAALAAWDAYLAVEPKGPLAVDARYDRALCLVRLGRKSEARMALQPFAQGTYGSYRQDDAKKLLEALH